MVSGATRRQKKAAAGEPAQAHADAAGDAAGNAAARQDEDEGEEDEAPEAEAGGAGEEGEEDEDAEEDEEEEDEDAKEDRIRKTTAALVRLGQSPANAEARARTEAGMRKRSRAESNAKKAKGGYVSKTPGQARAEGDLVVTGGSERTCVMDASARALELDSQVDAERVRKLRKMVPADADENTRFSVASKVLREEEGKKLVPVTAEFNHKGGTRLNLLLAGKAIFEAERKLLVGLHVKVPHAKKGDSHCVFYSGKAVYNNTYLVRSTRTGDYSSYPVTEVQEKDLTPEGALAFWGSLYPSHWVSPSRVFEVVEASDPREGL